MLKELRIENLALIEELHVNFDSSLVVFTGETGAGKSIILQAIDLLSGKRASASWVRNGSDQARVEALFELFGRHELLSLIRSMGVDTEGEILLSRVLSQKGKSRFYINGALANAKMVEQISEYLLAVAGQHDHQLLLVPRHHLDFVDLIGDLWQEREAFATLFQHWAAIQKSYVELQKKEREKEQQRDFLAFQLNEIREAQITLDEDLELDIKKRRLKAVDELRNVGRKCYQLLNTQAKDALAIARKSLEVMSSLDDNISDLATTVAEQSFVIEDSVAALSFYIDNLPNDQHELEIVTARIDHLQKMKRKYGPNLSDVLDNAEVMEKELQEIDSLQEFLIETEQKYLIVEKNMREKANALSDNRQRVGANLALVMQDELKSLCLKDASFTVQFNEPDRSGALPTKLGWDQTEFYFSANPGEPLKPLAKIASGGELSRLTLALRCILARKDMVETVIFDEVDAGLGGKAAEAVARKIKELALHHQVMCITHLPQIASCAQEHMRVEKNVLEGRTVTTIKTLIDVERVAELARMLDGDSVSENSMAFASELIARNNDEG